MLTPNAGYITATHNMSGQGSRTVWGHVTVHDGHTAMVSYKEFLSMRGVTLYHHIKQHDQSTGQDREEQRKVWNRFIHLQSDFVQIVNATKLSVEVLGSSCVKTVCFRLYFSFFPHNNIPRRMTSDLWNCSTDQYLSFRVHVDCNLKTECDDGRDEAGHCPYSSSECQGNIALCGHCYKFVESHNKIRDTDRRSWISATEYCASLEGFVSFPKCRHNWMGVVTNMVLVHRIRFSGFWFGVYVNDLSLPAMYRHVRSQDRTVFHHSFNFLNNPSKGVKQCLVVDLLPKPCDVAMKKSRGLLCELNPNNTTRESDPSNNVFLTSMHQTSWLEQLPLAVCHSGHVTYTFLLCGSNQSADCSPDISCAFSPYRSRVRGEDLELSSGLTVPMFQCRDNITTSYTLVCDFITDCPDNSDEDFCQHPLCVGAFTCNNGRCLSYDDVCDQLPQCVDDSDEGRCVNYREYYVNIPFMSSPVKISFDGVRSFTATKLYVNESCPDSHYRCPGDFNDCLPIYTRCNEMYDCLDHKDEDGCEDLVCPGFFRCRRSTTCIHSDQLCDGWPHCPRRDDELGCDTSCPLGCLCQAHAFLCPKSFSGAKFSTIRSLDATGSGMTLSDVNNLIYVIHLVLAHCSLTFLSKTNTPNLRLLNLSENKLTHVNMTYFVGLKRLRSLSLSGNPISAICTDLPSVVQPSVLSELDLSFTALTQLHTQILSIFPGIQLLNLTFTNIHTISSRGFQFTPLLRELYLDGSPVLTFPPNVFEGLSHMSVVYTHNYKLCCKQILPGGFDSSDCHAPKNQISSCEDLLQSQTYRAFLWLMACVSVTGNVFSLCARLFARSMSSVSGFSVFVTNLTMADFLMGVYIAIIGVADEQFRGKYLHYDVTWKFSVACKVAGFLSLLSSEVSALVIWLITLDRFVVIRFPFSTFRFERASASAVCALTWLAGCFLAMLPLLPWTSHWEFYSQTGICIPLPITGQDFKGKSYSFSVFIVLNFIIFLLVSIGQAFIYWSVQRNTLKTNTTKVSQDMTLARRLITVAVTDFMCWFPIGLCGMLALTGAAIPEEVNVALAIFVLPLNSAINPFMYTLNTLVEKRQKSHEEKLVKWLETQSDAILI